jgi:type IV secretory pathway component VirB8
MIHTICAKTLYVARHKLILNLLLVKPEIFTAVACCTCIVMICVVPHCKSEGYVVRHTVAMY